MKSHGIDFVGKLWIQGVPTLPEWTLADDRRLIFVEDEQIVYIGGNAQSAKWIAIGQQFSDVGDGTDPETDGPFLGRWYKLEIENGNITLVY